MAKPELGTKRLCTNCGAKFYDLSKDPIVCPKCHTVLELAAVSRQIWVMLIQILFRCQLEAHPTAW